MALSDYYCCDICGKKTFYDASCYAGFPENRNEETGHPWPDGNIGDMAVICQECSKKFKIVIIDKEADELNPK